MLKIQPNSRQIPSDEKYTADKRYNDLLYGVFQELSYFEDGIRYVNKKDVSYTILGKKMNLTRQTISTRFKHLLELGLIEYEEDKKRYKLCMIEKTLCSLVPFETLRMLNNTLNQNSISTYVYLLKRFIANKEEPYQVLIGQIKEFIGIATSTTSNNEIVTDILLILEKIGLVEYDKVKNEEGKWNIIIKKVKNTIG